MGYKYQKLIERMLTVCLSCPATYSSLQPYVINIANGILAPNWLGRDVVKVGVDEGGCHDQGKLSMFLCVSSGSSIAFPFSPHWWAAGPSTHDCVSCIYGRLWHHNPFVKVWKHSSLLSSSQLPYGFVETGLKGSRGKKAFEIKQQQMKLIYFQH